MARASAPMHCWSGHSLEFVATFTGGPYQHVGFGVDYFTGPWAIFSTDQTGCPVPGAHQQFFDLTPNETTSDLSGDWLPRRTVSASNGTLIRSCTSSTECRLPVMQPRCPRTCDLWLLNTRQTGIRSPSTGCGSHPIRHQAPSNPGCSTAVGTATWGAPAWTADVPLNTEMIISVRTGDTPVPDASWSDFTPVIYGWPINQTSRYLQYQVEMQTTDTLVTPILYDITIGLQLATGHNPAGDFRSLTCARCNRCAAGCRCGRYLR